MRHLCVVFFVVVFFSRFISLQSHDCATTSRIIPHLKKIKIIIVVILMNCSYSFFSSYFLDSSCGGKNLFVNIKKLPHNLEKTPPERGAAAQQVQLLQITPHFWAIYAFRKVRFLHSGKCNGEKSLETNVCLFFYFKILLYFETWWGSKTLS